MQYHIITLIRFLEQLFPFLILSPPPFIIFFARYTIHLLFFCFDTFEKERLKERIERWLQLKEHFITPCWMMWVLMEPRAPFFILRVDPIVLFLRSLPHIPITSQQPLLFSLWQHHHLQLNCLTDWKYLSLNNEKIKQISETITKTVDQNANIIFGTEITENMLGKIRVSLLACGLQPKPSEPKKSPIWEFLKKHF